MIREDPVFLKKNGLAMRLFVYRQNFTTALETTAKPRLKVVERKET